MSNATFKAVLQPYKNTTGLHNVLIRVTMNRRRKFARTEYYVLQKQFNAKSGKVQRHPQADRWNQTINGLITKAQTKIMEEKAKDRPLSLDQVKKILEGNFHEHDFNFFTYAERYIDARYDEVKNFARVKSLKFALHKLKDHAGKDLSLYDITPIFILEYRRYLLNEKYSSGYINDTIRNIKFFIDKARSDSSIMYNDNPFSDYHPLKVESSLERKSINDEELLRLERLELTNAKERMWRDTWLAMYYLGGMRPSDVYILKVSDFEDAKYYKMKKNKKFTSIVVHERVERLLQPYMFGKAKADYVFPHLDGYHEGTLEYERKIKALNSSFNGYTRKLAEKAKITIEFTPKTARRTFANQVRDRLGKRFAQEALNHSDERTTEAYLENINTMKLAIEKVFHSKEIPV